MSKKVCVKILYNKHEFFFFLEIFLASRYRSMLQVLLTACGLAAATAIPVSRRLECGNESAQLFPIDIELLAVDGTIIYSSLSSLSSHPYPTAPSDEAPAKVCGSYPVEVDGDKWGSFEELSAVQFAVPPTAAGSVSQCQ